MCISISSNVSDSRIGRLEPVWWCSLYHQHPILEWGFESRGDQQRVAHSWLFAWPSAGCWGHLENELADRALSPYLSLSVLPLSVTLLSNQYMSFFKKIMEWLYSLTSDTISAKSLNCNDIYNANEICANNKINSVSIHFENRISAPWIVKCSPAVAESFESCQFS